MIKYSLFAMFIINPFRRVIRCNKSNILKEINFRIAGSNFPKQLTSSGKLSFWITWIQTFHGSLFLQVLYFFLFFFFRCFSFFFVYISWVKMKWIHYLILYWFHLHFNRKREFCQYILCRQPTFGNLSGI